MVVVVSGSVVVVLEVELVVELVEGGVEVVASTTGGRDATEVAEVLPPELQAAANRPIAPTMINRFIYCTQCNCFARHIPLAALRLPSLPAVRSSLPKSNIERPKRGSKRRTRAAPAMVAMKSHSSGVGSNAVWCYSERSETTWPARSSMVRVRRMRCRSTRSWLTSSTVPGNVSSGLFELLDGRQVEVVRRLVEHEAVATRRPPSTSASTRRVRSPGDSELDRPIDVCGGDAELGQQRARLADRHARCGEERIEHVCACHRAQLVRTCSSRPTTHG